MIVAILHQVIWTAVSFALFCILFRAFVINQIFKMQFKRFEYIASLQKRIDDARSEIDSLNKISDQILHEEIPNDIKCYLESKMKDASYSLQLTTSHELTILKKQLKDKAKITGDIKLFDKILAQDAALLLNNLERHDV